MRQLLIREQCLQREQKFSPRFDHPRRQHQQQSNKEDGLRDARLATEAITISPTTALATSVGQSSAVDSSLSTKTSLRLVDSDGLPKQILKVLVES
jgi:hypothetical protein